MKLLYIDANGTNGEQPEHMVAVYLVAGRRVAVPAHLSEEAAKLEIASRFGLSAQQVENLSQVEARLNDLNLDRVDQLTDNAGPTQLVAALKDMRQLVGELQAALRFQMMSEVGL